MIKKAMPLWLSATFLLLQTMQFNKAQAQNNTYRLGDLYQQAIQKYPGIESRKEQIQAVIYEKKKVNTLQLPQVNLQLQNTFGTFQGTTGSAFPLPGVFNVSGGDVNQSNGNAIATTYGSAVADWTIFSFGKIQQQKQAASHKIAEAEKDLSAYELNLKSQITQLYFYNLFYLSKYEWAKENARRVNEILEISRSYAEAGLKPGADTSLAASAYAKIKADVAKWKGKLAANEEQIQEFIQLPFTASPESNNAYLKQRPLVSTKNPRHFNHPYLSVLESRIDYFDAMEKYAGRSALPSASLLGGLSMRGSGIENGQTTQNWGSSFENPRNNYLVGIGIKWNLTDGLKSKHNQKQLQHQKSSVTADYKQRELQLNAAIAASQKSLIQEMLRTDAIKESVEKAKTAFELYNSRYESGLLSLTELLQIQFILQESEKDQIEAYQELWDTARLQAEYTADFSGIFSIF